ncbi:WD40-repeat-containing domain protein [Kockovaella imperatae]|uniref:WD40-repeat-containing domain protein n=1 Tax=Kockovaella imperatae TaxID=4999 RepID=A0A1Y1UNM2_9TREE|nr:WD40-repeat-containing domain protein [Kockovaella imperatae]ORX39643.1 WD40-repeat-containing domain protein [Kockovaella imperatae]
MLQTNLLAPGHADLVTHVVYDFYGERIATCSADQRIKIFRRSNEGLWEPEADWKAHDAAILHLSFSHPLHGSLLASCSHDRTVRIWEEGPRSHGTKEGRWIERAVLGGAKGSVRVLEFSPPNPSFGLRLAAISTDSRLRVYTSLDPSLNDWSTAHDIHLPSLASPYAGQEETRINENATVEISTGGWGLSWCKEKFWGSLLAAFSGTSPTVKIIVLDPAPTALLHLTTPAPASPLTCVAWANSCGRSYHLVATGSRDGRVIIWKVEPPDPEERGRGEWKGEIVADFGKGPRIGTVDWNATGTTLTVSDDDGMIRVYKPTYSRDWKLMGQMTAEEPPPMDDRGH